MAVVSGFSRTVAPVVSGFSRTVIRMQRDGEKRLPSGLRGLGGC